MYGRGSQVWCPSPQSMLDCEGNVLRTELLFDENESVTQLTARELQDTHRFKRFVVHRHIQSCRVAVDALINDIQLSQGLYDCDTAALQDRI